jgi:hypothetical protein
MIPYALEIPLKRGKMRVFTGASVSYDDFCSSLEDGADKIRNFISRILIISISIDDDISSEHETVHNTMMECDAQTTVSLKLYYVVDTQFSRYS